MELIATLNYSFREMKATVGKKPPRNEVFARFREFKRDKFNEREIAETYERLEGAGLLD
jgi:hypothetical protein